MKTYENGLKQLRLLLIMHNKDGFIFVVRVVYISGPARDIYGCAEQTFSFAPIQADIV